MVLGGFDFDLSNFFGISMPLRNPPVMPRFLTHTVSLRGDLEQMHHEVKLKVPVVRM
jgi:hypothetical protein